MEKKSNFYIAPDFLGDTDPQTQNTDTGNPNTAPDHSNDCSGLWTQAYDLSSESGGLTGTSRPKDKSLPEIPANISAAEVKKFTEKLIAGNYSPVVHTAATENPKSSAVVRFSAPGQGINADLEIPLDITAIDLITGLNIAYHLGIDISDIHDCYLRCEHPIALLKGKRSLGEYGIRDGALIIFLR